MAGSEWRAATHDMLHNALHKALLTMNAVVSSPVCHPHNVIMLREGIADARAVLDAASVVPAEPATHDTLVATARDLPREPPFGAYLRFMRNGNTRDAGTLQEWDTKWKALRAAVAAVDGEAPAT